MFFEVTNKNCFISYRAILSREAVVKLIADGIGSTDIIIGTTGMLSRELFEHRLMDNIIT